MQTPICQDFRLALRRHSRRGLLQWGSLAALGSVTGGGGAKPGE